MQITRIWTLFTALVLNVNRNVSLCAYDVKSILQHFSSLSTVNTSKKNSIRHHFCLTQIIILEGAHIYALPSDTWVCWAWVYIRGTNKIDRWSVKISTVIKCSHTHTQTRMHRIYANFFNIVTFLCKIFRLPSKVSFIIWLKKLSPLLVPQW